MPARSDVEPPRSGDDRKLLLLCPDRRSGPRLLVLSAALRRRSGFFELLDGNDTRPPRRAFSTSSSRTSPQHPGLSAQHRDAGHHAWPTPKAAPSRSSTSRRASSITTASTGRYVGAPGQTAPGRAAHPHPAQAPLRLRRRGARDQRGSNHVRYASDRSALRLTTDAPPSLRHRRDWFVLEEPVSLVFGPDEALALRRPTGRAASTRARRDYWHEWVRYLSIPFEWQEAVIRAAITLKLCNFEETGGIVAAMTTSIPEAAEQRSQLGLSLLLAARRLFRHPRAQPPGRHADHGGISSATSPTSSRTPTTGICNRSMAWRATRASSKRKFRICPATAGWGRSGSATQAF